MNEGGAEVVVQNSAELAGMPVDGERGSSEVLLGLWLQIHSHPSASERAMTE